MTLPSGRTVSYRRDAVQRVSGIDSTLGGVAHSVLTDVQYSAAGQVTYIDRRGELAWDPIAAAGLVVGGGLIGGIAAVCTVDSNRGSAFIDGVIFGATSGAVASMGTTVTGKIVGALIGSTLSGAAAVSSSASGGSGE